MNRFKSHWYYWHTGHRRIAVISMMVSAAGMWLVLVIAAGFSLWGIILAMLLDAAGLWLAVIYLVLLRNELTTFPGLQDKADALIIESLIIPVIISFLVTRIVTFVVAKSSGYAFWRE